VREAELIPFVAFCPARSAMPPAKRHALMIKIGEGEAEHEGIRSAFDLALRRE
jgi:hypothetical protein